MRLRPRVPRSNRAVLKAIKLLYFGAVVELAVAITIMATIGDVKSTIIKRNPGYTEVQWHAEVAGNFDRLWWRPVSRLVFGCGWPGRLAADIVGRGSPLRSSSD
jgi:hypothetical protein